MEEKILNGLKYLEKHPKNFSAEEKHPVILFLHGAGSRGQDFTELGVNPFLKLSEKHEEFPFIIFAPLCSENTWFDMWELLKQLVYHIEALPYADPERIYLVGNSMGGYGTWQLAMSMPEHFAAIVPICGGGMYWNVGRLINVPVWAFHGGKDDVVFTEESVKMVEGLNKRGGNAKLTIYPENQHDAWTDTYNNPEVFAWLLSHRNKNAAVNPDSYKDAKNYG